MHLADSHSAVDNQFSTVFLEVKCDSNMVGYHYIYDILGANYGTLSLIIIPPFFQSIYMPAMHLLHTNMRQPCGRLFGAIL